MSRSAQSQPAATAIVPMSAAAAAPDALSDRARHAASATRTARGTAQRSRPVSRRAPSDRRHHAAPARSVSSMLPSPVSAAVGSEDNGGKPAGAGSARDNPRTPRDAHAPRCRGSAAVRRPDVRRAGTSLLRKLNRAGLCDSWLGSVGSETVMRGWKDQCAVLERQ